MKKFEEFIGLVNEGCILSGRGMFKLIIYNYCIYIYILLDLPKFQLVILYELFHSLALCFLSPNFLCFLFQIPEQWLNRQSRENFTIFAFGSTKLLEELLHSSFGP